MKPEDQSKLIELSRKAADLEKRANIEGYLDGLKVAYNILTIREDNEVIRLIGEEIEKVKKANPGIEPTIK
jgi:uncharacterized DUF497 family protein